MERLPWGTHACQFYRSPADLVEMLVPYFAAGLRANEACLWITSGALGAREAKELMREAVPGFDASLAKGQIEIRDVKDWYTAGSRFDGADVLEAWLEQEQRALKRGYAGLRLTGDTSWVERAAWNDFMAYERKVNEVFPRHRLIGLCTYCLDLCSAEDVMEIARRHEFALVRGGASRELAEDTASARPRIPLSHPPALQPTLGDVLYARKPEVLVTERDWVDLVRSAGAGDQPALHALYEKASRPVFTLAMRITGNREAAEEVTLDVFHDVWRRAARYDPMNGTVLGWIMNQARSRSIDRIRFDQRKKRVDAAPESMVPETAADASQALEHAEQAGALRKAMACLSAAERKAIEAAFFEELTYAEVAARLREPLGTVKTRIRMGLHKLRRALAGEERA